jgi:hypothetical protein
LYTIPILDIKRAKPLHIITEFREFLRILKDQVDEHMPSPSKDEYWSVLVGQMTSMIKESGAIRKIVEIDKRFGLYKEP